MKLELPVVNEDPSFAELKKLSDVIYYHLGTRDPQKVQNWIIEARREANRLQWILDFPGKYCWEYTKFTREKIDEARTSSR